jgi:hypothetical protein
VGVKKEDKKNVKKDEVMNFDDDIEEILPE